MKIALDTLGCKLNQSETELLAQQLVKAGHRLVSSIDEANVYILNTCTVTHVADSKSRHLLRLAHRRNPEAFVVATGCYAQRSPHQLAGIEGISLVVGNNEKEQLPRLLEQSGYPPASMEASDSPSLLRTRAFIKAQDGCSSFCTYCIVPIVRGREKSLPLEQVLSEVKERAAENYKEVVLTGTKIGSYLNDRMNLKDLLERILHETDVPRVRLSSLQLQEISRELITLWGDSRLCPHFHLSLQSGSDTVLERMKRRYTVIDYQQAVSLIRSMVPDAAITTDIITGFPGETEQEFEESYKVCQGLVFSRIHVFPYSPRQGTEAALMPQLIDDATKKQRTQKMLALAKESTYNFRQQFLGKTRPVLWEKESNGVWSGLTDNYIKVYTRSAEDLTNRLLPVEVLKSHE
jgi:threonylcarbamoyladenosine tRNA methylthiotransferase MtaB